VGGLMFLWHRLLLRSLPACSQAGVHSSGFMATSLASLPTTGEKLHAVVCKGLSFAPQQVQDYTSLNLSHVIPAKAESHS